MNTHDEASPPSDDIRWRIVLQKEGDSAVKCKHLKFFPDRQPDDSVRLRRFSYLLFRMILVYGNGLQHKITWSNKSGRGKFIYHLPTRRVFPTYKAANGRTYEDRWEAWSPKVEKPGDKKEFCSIEVFRKWVYQKFGEDVGNEILAEFDKRLPTEWHCRIRRGA